jgi:hypothetical protein
MKHPLLALTLALIDVAASAAPASAPAASGPDQAAAQACERAAQDTLRDTRGATAAAVFSAPPTAQPGAADATEITLRGAGQVRTPTGSRAFSYSCTYDTQAAAVSGVVVRDASAPKTAPVARSVEPDLSHLSPAACESAAAGALKRRWPNVANISFSADTRALTQDAAGNASLRGQGSALPTVRDPATHFSYDCTIDARNGRVIGLRIAD